ncbi:CDP-glycerol glycerophosphotransferase family protein [Methanothermobacter tenebrarum]|uniref:CDP-glycerol glycerophosphotransferase family protein n=2 Tax=Methanothermobacter tenebrarum TaxID=680118 RepID=A0A328P900_9EURY|nr:CDP-glycerol glycerophosphotransferase family protein [Methanothermobacter tenebrarum]
MGQFTNDIVTKLSLGLRGILRMINRIIPKRDDLIIFTSIPDFSDNSLALFEFMKSLDENLELVWIVNKPRDNIRAYTRYDVKGILKILRARCIISTHGNLRRVRVPSQIFVNLWHGMPFKAIGYTGNKNIIPFNFDDENYYLIATSTVMRNALAACFNQDPRRIYVTGQPRNDKLFEGCDKKIFKILDIDPGAYEKIVLFAPTFRKTDVIDDGKVISYKFNLPDFNRTKFRDFLKKHKILFLVKFHPLEEKLASEYFKEMDNVMLIKNKVLQENLMDTYNILPCADILVTDYSSIFFDFLLLDRPIIFVVSDLDEYRAKRGFVLEPFEFWTPGPKVKNFQEFFRELEKSIDNPDYYKKERKIINDLINYYKDEKSSQRIYRLFRARIGE